MYYEILNTLQTAIFGEVQLEAWQQSFLAIASISIITIFFIALAKLIFGAFRMVFKWWA